MSERKGPLAGVKVLELPNIGPLQHAGMMLADLGAEVLRLDRKAHVEAGSGLQGPYTPYSILDRGRRSAGIDLKHPLAAALVVRLAERADVVVEGFRPGVAERLGVGPDVLCARNPRLVYGRMTGWGQTGPLANEVGHDINYIALAGVLAYVGPAGGAPVPPLNLVGDFGGGSMLLVLGVLAALVERGTSGKGQVVDAAMVDGSSMLMSIFHVFDQIAPGMWGPRGTNLLDGGAHFYGVYECRDGTYVSVAAFEPQFYAAFVRLVTGLRIAGLGADDLKLEAQHDRTQWPLLRERLAAMFRTRTRDEWLAFFAGHEICFAPVLTMEEARRHPHNVARGTFTTVDGVEQNAPAPRFSRTPGAIAHAAHAAGADTDAAFADWGIAPNDVAALRAAGAVA
ncbi:MAG: CoA transferase [Deltaproteobacteria bacterium]|nr:CoA transferase [Deltaproteobacteria bacterium]